MITGIERLCKKKETHARSLVADDGKQYDVHPISRLFTIRVCREFEQQCHGVTQMYVTLLHLLLRYENMCVLQQQHVRTRICGGERVRTGGRYV